jgi:hypothetical protein
VARRGGPGSGGIGGGWRDWWRQAAGRLGNTPRFASLRGRAFGELAAIGRGLAKIIRALGGHIVANFSHSVESAG